MDLLTADDLGRGAPPAPGTVIVADSSRDTLLTVAAAVREEVPLVLLHPRLTELEKDALRATLTAAPPPGTLAVLFTSGTTGRPKGVVLSRRAFLAAAAASEANLGWRPDDRWLLSLPLAHVGGLSVLVRCLLAKKPVVLSSDLPDSVARHRVTLVSLVPTQLRRLVATGYTPPPHLRAVLLGGAPAAPDLLDLAAAHGWPLLPTYGLTEACAQVATRRPSRDDAGVGPPLPGVKVRIAADGVIEIAGPTLMTGYLGGPPLPEGAWLRTGDLGRLDERGCLHVLGRRDDVIITGGENVHPAEVEACLTAAPGVAEACVYPLPHPEWGQLVAAAVVPGAGYDEARLDAHLRARLAPWKRPRRIVLLDALPLTPSGKPDRRALAAR